MEDGIRNLLHSNITISMVVLALDTTTRGGSLALTRDGVPLEVYVGNPGRAHGERLPGEVIRLLARQRLAISDVDLYAVAAGPGSFTGLRIGIATMQGLALVNGRGIAAVSALDALRTAIAAGESAAPSAASGPTGLIGAWMDARRGEVFAALYQNGSLLDGPDVGSPAAILKRWGKIRQQAPIVFVGDGALVYAGAIHSFLADQGRVVEPVPPLAPAIARLAEALALAEAPLSPDAVRPLYVRRPDAELARDRAKA